VIETCHEAGVHAAYANRSKVKVDDFQFALRKDSRKLGRVQELLDIDRDLKNKRKAFNVDEGNVGKDVAPEVKAANKRAKRAAEKEKKKARSAVSGEGDEE
jgi:transcription initiation factor TFIID subunit 13